MLGTSHLGLGWGGGGDKSVIDAGNKGGIHGLKSSRRLSNLGFGWGGGGGDKSVHVPLHTKALHLDRLSSEALHLEHSLGQGRGVAKAFMFLYSQKHCALIACHLKHCTLNIVLGRGRGGDKSVHVPLRTKYCTLIACHLKHCTLSPEPSVPISSPPPFFFAKSSTKCYTKAALE